RLTNIINEVTMLSGTGGMEIIGVTSYRQDERVVRDGSAGKLAVTVGQGDWREIDLLALPVQSAKVPWQVDETIALGMWLKTEALDGVIGGSSREGMELRLPCVREIMIDEDHVRPASASEPPRQMRCRDDATDSSADDDHLMHGRTPILRFFS